MGTFACDSCDRFSLAYFSIEGNPSGLSNQEYLERMDSSLCWLPTRGQQPPTFEDVPEHIANAAQEAYRCRSIHAHRAAVLLARSVIEATAKEQGIKKGTLADKIQEMHDQRLIREHIQVGAHEIRYLGNDMAHGDFIDPIEHEDSQLVLQLMSEVLFEVFESPARVAKARAARLAKQSGTPTA